MRTQDIRVRLRDGEMGAHVAYPERTPAPRDHRHHGDLGRERHQCGARAGVAEAGFVCLVPDLFLAPGARVELYDRNPRT